MSEEIRKIMNRLHRSKEPLYERVMSFENMDVFQDVESKIEKWNETKRPLGFTALEKAKEYIKEKIKGFEGEANTIFEHLGPKNFKQYVEFRSKDLYKDPVYIETRSVLRGIENEIKNALNQLAGYLEVLEGMRIPTFDITLTEEDMTEGLTHFQREVVLKDIKDRNLVQYPLLNLVNYYKNQYPTEATTEAVLGVFNRLAESGEWKVRETITGGVTDYLLIRA